MHKNLSLRRGAHSRVNNILNNTNRPNKSIFQPPLESTKHFAPSDLPKRNIAPAQARETCPPHRQHQCCAQASPIPPRATAAAADAAAPLAVAAAALTAAAEDKPTASAAPPRASPSAPRPRAGAGAAAVSRRWAIICRRAIISPRGRARTFCTAVRPPEPPPPPALEVAAAAGATRTWRRR